MKLALIYSKYTKYAKYSSFYRVALGRDEGRVGKKKRKRLGGRGGGQEGEGEIMHLYVSSLIYSINSQFGQFQSKGHKVRYH